MLLSRSNPRFLLFSISIYVTYIYHALSVPQQVFPVDSPPTNTKPNSFPFELSCNQSAFCDKARVAVQAALNRLSSVISTRKPIVSYFQFKDLCAATGNANCTLLGYASPVGGFVVKITSSAFITSSSDNVKVGMNPGAVYLLPPSLVKQSNIDTSAVSMSRYDISATFNSNYNWWFAEDNQPIQSHQADMELVVLHEMLHGLGVGISSFTLKPDYPNMLIPMYSKDKTNLNNYQFQSPTVWDAFLKINGQGSSAMAWLQTFDQYNAAVRGKVTSKTTEQEFLGLSVKTPILAQDSQSRYALCTTVDAVEFIPRASSIATIGTLSPTGGILLETGLKPYVVGASMAHLSANTYKGTGDYLMLNTTPSVILSQAKGYASTYLQSGIGPSTVMVLQSFGYQINGLSDNVQLLSGQIVSIDLGIAAAGSIQRPSAYVFFFIVMSALGMFL